MKSKKIVLLMVSILIISLLTIGCKATEEAVTPEDNQEAVEYIEDEVAEELKIVASTSWTALMAEAAGAKNVVVLAPVELKHPPEYDFKPSDVVALQEADFIIMAGYEGFMNKMIEANNIDQKKIIKVTTTNTYVNLHEQTHVIADAIGTQEGQAQWEAEFKKVISKIMKKAQDHNVAETKVLVHVHMQAFVKSLGYDVVAVFGAEELSPAKMGELANMGPDLIIDNYHNPQGMTIAELANVERVELRNFPGPDHSSLIDLFKDNVKLLGLE
ncbi:metal ABC transporter solute-binding protein, Zn/Mn family [Alkaliphilus serpentinus]|nr:zinc ABC transporter substrate-binding protein [Alkaliphilus serpentinus]